MKCENCGNEHDGSYGSGRFCSSKCARGFSTKAKRKEINEKVSKKLKKEKKKNFCEVCGKEISSRRKYLRCNDHKMPVSKETKEKLSTSRIEKIKQGYLNKPCRVEVNYKGNIIKCDSKLEVAVLEYLRSLGEEHINRNFDHVDYDFNGETKKFLPDFITENYLVEAKSIIGNSLNEKWHSYKEQVPLKKEALIKKADELGKKPLWLNKSENKELRKIYTKFFKKSIFKYELK